LLLALLSVPSRLFLAVGLVVLALIADPVLQREAVMRGDEIQRRPGTAPVVIEQIGRALQTRRQRPRIPESPRQKRRTSSRNLSFHSAMPAG
jgi:hypothetical protein